ncbi:hypothetical protein CEUSTIGMA_g12170.t1 [Chlamydomonas eustigma]|uniref:cysteine--tRNA ligase n=1 Tax=Chlamydomonas eustigma TaxID=1157962 RepID=A0A250XNV0_9CHLO|nr:hypothetical protein CEUSTIGMA_g12170.t1 [Chlamydomonas eustigma]|eukprot:GAX84748.1 hypothetical protein CEUSTIGMA_g12170.t1 [Chlamydomonas eustigma]
MSKTVREWFPPHGADSPKEENGRSTQVLKLYNSLLDERVPFVPADGPGSKQISWYTCGPTVYDVAHVGHARNYLTFDIIRRVLEDYFGYNCLFVMNVTDVDDKIILRARRNFLLKEYMNQSKSVDEVKTYAFESVQTSLNKQTHKYGEMTGELSDLISKDSTSSNETLDKSGRRKINELEGALKNEAHKLKKITDASAYLQSLTLTGTDHAADMDSILSVAGDYMAEALDTAAIKQGINVSDATIYRAHAAKFEADFLEDMDSLGCRPPDVLTRVSEYIPEIIEYVQRILDNGMAYESNGSVYFDTRNFKECGHTYGKLKPWAVGSALLASEGESNFETSEKRTPSDFALWKASKPGEPFWDSPWGHGRPGWHIECSAMASSILGSQMDIHSGGEDLKFPHHDNELAQAEAYYHHQGCRQWVNYFLHTGHLEVEGLKMSKSLKNFISIKDALQRFSARQLRLMFALQTWNKSMMYGEAARTEMTAREAQLKNFFQNVEVVTRNVQQTKVVARWTADELDLSQRLQAAQKLVHERFCDNIDTAGALDAISALIKHVNLYLAKKEGGSANASNGAPPQALLLRKAAAYVTRILSVLGIVDVPADRPGFSDFPVAASGENKGFELLDTMSMFRDEVRALARSKAKHADVAAVCERSRETLSATTSMSGKAAEYFSTFTSFLNEIHSLAVSTADLKDILGACDRLRDDALVDLGVRLEDKPDGKAVWKLDDPATLRAEQAERAQQASDAACKKLQTQLTLKQKDKEKYEKLLALPPVEQSLADRYSKFDAVTGYATHDKDGNALEGKAIEKAKKDLEKAKKVLEPLTKKLAEDPDFLQKLNIEIDALTKQIEALRG